MKKNPYTYPKAELVAFSAEDILTASTEPDGDETTSEGSDTVVPVELPMDSWDD